MSKRKSKTQWSNRVVPLLLAAFGLALLGLWLTGCQSAEDRKEWAAEDESKCVDDAVHNRNLSDSDAVDLIAGCHQVYLMRIDR